MHAMPTPSAHRLALVAAQTQPRQAAAPKVRRYRLARLRATSRAPEAPRYAYLKKLYD
jgi:hypothetical protein